jgi:hypothetical protein
MRAREIGGKQKVKKALTVQPNDDPDGLERLQTPDNPGDGAQDASFLTGGRCLRRWRFREEAAIARAFRAQVVRTKLAVEPLRRAAHERLAQQDGGVGEQVSARRVVGAV